MSGALLAATLLTACGGDEPEESALDSINEAVLDAMRLEAELQGVVNRLTVDCMTDAGFDVHPLELTQDPTEWLEDGQSITESEPPGLYEIPVSVAEAEEIGLDIGRYNDPDFDWDAYEEEQGGPEMGPDPFWEEMSDAYREEYEKARYGEEYYEYMYSEDPETYDDQAEPPAEAGCAGDVRGRISDATGTEDGYVEWPDSLNDWEAQIEMYETEAVLTAQDDWSACVEDRGHPYFEFKDGSLDMWSYVNSFYEGMGEMVDETGEEPAHEPPPGAPWPFEEAYAKEVALAVDMAECSDETGLRETLQTEWDNTMETMAVEHQDEIFAWHDKLETALAEAQKLLQN
ncbi:hypothetical protein GCM10023223_27740 [Stackebrandtia albiflava]